MLMHIHFYFYLLLIIIFLIFNTLPYIYINDAFFYIYIFYQLICEILILYIYNFYEIFVFV